MPGGIKYILIDFGGVIAEEGFYKGLLAVGSRNGIDPELFFKIVDELIYTTGYLTGDVGEAAFWNAVRAKTGITERDAELREEIMQRFTLRPRMLGIVDRLRSSGMTVAMLSDQTNWLDEIDDRTGLFRHFDVVFNSYRLRKSKRDASLFPEVCAKLGAAPGETLFIDDNLNHIKRAESRGLQTLHFTGVEDGEAKLALLGTGRT